MRTSQWLVLSVLAISGCVSGPRLVRRPEAFLMTNRPERVWIERADGSQLVVEQPRLYGDTLFGFVAGGREEVWMPLDQARQLRARQLDRTRTTLLIAAGGVALGIALATLSSNGTGLDRDVLDRPEMILIPIKTLLPR